MWVCFLVNRFIPDKINEMDLLVKFNLLTITFINYSYKLVGSQLAVIKEEIYLGVKVNNSISICISWKIKANRILGIIRNSIKNRGANITLV